MSTVKEYIGLGLFFAGLSISALMGYVRGDSAITNRVTAIETHQSSSEKRLDRIESKVDELLNRVPAR